MRCENISIWPDLPGGGGWESCLGLTDELCLVESLPDHHLQRLAVCQPRQLRQARLGRHLLHHRLDVLGGGKVNYRLQTEANISIFISTFECLEASISLRPVRLNLLWPGFGATGGGTFLLGEPLANSILLWEPPANSILLWDPPVNSLVFLAGWALGLGRTGGGAVCAVCAVSSFGLRSLLPAGREGPALEAVLLTGFFREEEVATSEEAVLSSLVLSDLVLVTGLGPGPLAGFTLGDFSSTLLWGDEDRDLERKK